MISKRSTILSLFYCFQIVLFCVCFFFLWLFDNHLLKFMIMGSQPRLQYIGSNKFNPTIVIICIHAFIFSLSKYHFSQNIYFARITQIIGLFSIFLYYSCIRCDYMWCDESFSFVLSIYWFYSVNFPQTTFFSVKILTSENVMLWSQHQMMCWLKQTVLSIQKHWLQLKNIHLNKVCPSENKQSNSYLLCVIFDFINKQITIHLNFIQFNNLNQKSKIFLLLIFRHWIG